MALPGLLAGARTECVPHERQVRDDVRCPAYVLVTAFYRLLPGVDRMR